MGDVLVHHPLKREVDMFLLVLFWYVVFINCVRLIAELYLVTKSGEFATSRIGNLIGITLRHGFVLVFLVLVYGHIPSL